MAQVDLKLNIGDTLQLQYLDRDSRDRLLVTVIGYLAGRSLIVTTPKLDGRVLMMREGQPFVVRILSGNRVVGFNTKVLRNSASPYPYMHLAYPQEMEQIVVRKAQRVRVRLFCSLENSSPLFEFNKPQPATMVDASVTGALIHAEQRLAEADDEVSLSFAFKMGGVEKLMTIPSRVRNVQLESREDGSTGYFHGLEFLPLEESDVIALHGFVYEQIVKSMGE